MGSTTSPNGLRYPAGADTVTLAAYFKNLADDTQAALPVVSDTEPTKQSGLLWYAPTAQLAKISDGTSWAVAGRAMQMGTAAATITTSAITATGTVTFPTAFATAPMVFSTCTVSDIFGCNITSVSATAFTFKVFVTSGSHPGSTISVTFNWLALAQDA